MNNNKDNKITWEGQENKIKILKITPAIRSSGLQQMIYFSNATFENLQTCSETFKKVKKH